MSTSEPWQYEKVERSDCRKPSRFFGIPVRPSGNLMTFRLALFAIVQLR